MSKRQAHEHGSKWSAEELERLTMLWASGMSSAAIGREMGTTKNAVVGQAHRMDLPGRPSPIIKRGQPRPQRAVRAPKETLTGLDIEKRGQSTSQLRRSLDLPHAPPPPPVITFSPASRPCCFPMWGRERAPNPPIFCSKPGEPGRPYCSKHMARCYVRKPAVELANAA